MARSHYARNAEAFESLRDEVLPGFAKGLKGYHDAQLLKRKLDEHTMQETSQNAGLIPTRTFENYLNAENPFR